MVAQSIASRPRKPQQTEPDDVVMARAIQALEWVKRNAVVASIIGIAVVVLVGGFLWYRTDASRRDEAAAIDFLPVEQAVLAGEETNAMRELQLFIQRHGDTTYGDEARLLLAQVHLRSGRAEDAITTVRPVAERIRGSALGAQAGLLLGAAQEAAGQTDAAIETYLRVGDQAQMEFRRVDGLQAAALLLGEAGEYDRATELYRQLAEIGEGTPQEGMYQMRLEEMEARAVGS